MAYTSQYWAKRNYARGWLVRWRFGAANLLSTINVENEIRPNTGVLKKKRAAIVTKINTAEGPRVQPWFVLSILAGNLIQLGGLLAGLTLVMGAARTKRPARTHLLLAGWLVTYFCNHAIGHWGVGRLAGIRFTGYGMHGTTAPHWYPPGMRWIFQHLPLFSARTDPASLKAAHPLARSAMYLGGPLLTLLTGLGIPLYGRAKHIPRAQALLIGTTLWFIPMLIVEIIRPAGDLHRAWRALRWNDN